MNILEALRAANVGELQRQRDSLQNSVKEFERDIIALNFAISAAMQSQKAVGVPAENAKPPITFAGIFSPQIQVFKEQYKPEPEQPAVEPPKSDPEPVPQVPEPTPVVETPEVKAEPAPVATEAVRELRPAPIPIVPKRTVKPVAPCGKKIEDHPPVTLTVANRAKVYLEAAATASTMALVTYLGLQDGKTLMRALEADPRFEKDSRGFWSLAK